MNSTASFRKGDTIKVFQKMKEGKRERTVGVAGKVLEVKGVGMNKMFTVRQTLEGVDVDRIYPLFSPAISRIEVVEMKKKTVVKKTRAKKTTKKAA